MLKIRKAREVYFHSWAAKLMGISYGKWIAMNSNPKTKLSKKEMEKLKREYYKNHKEEFERIIKGE